MRSSQKSKIKGRTCAARLNYQQKKEDGVNDINGQFRFKCMLLSRVRETE
jgi:hypothetical protein